MLNIFKLLDKLDIVYFSYDSKNNIIVPDKKYANDSVYGELVKITYYLSKKRIMFDVLKDKSIVLKKHNNFTSKFKLLAEKMQKKCKDKSIYIVSSKKVEGITNITLSEILYYDVTFDTSCYDALLITSKNAFDALLRSKVKWKKIPLYVISEESAKLVKDNGGKVAYFSRFHHGKEFAEELEQRLEGKKVLYLRGEEVACDMAEALREKGISCESMVVYENRFKKECNPLTLPKNAKIIFPSPSSIKHFLHVYEWQESFKAICIGKTTFAALPKEIKGYMAEKTSFESCKEKAREI